MLANTGGFFENVFENLESFIREEKREGSSPLLTYILMIASATNFEGAKGKLVPPDSRYLNDNSIDLGQLSWKLLKEGLLYNVPPDSVNSEGQLNPSLIKIHPVATMIRSLVEGRPEYIIGPSKIPENEQPNPEIMRTLFLGREDSITRYYYNQYVAKAGVKSEYGMGYHIKESESTRFNMEQNGFLPLRGLIPEFIIDSNGTKEKAIRD